MSTLDLDAVRAKWLVQCAAHDAGMSMSCTCPDGDPRNVIDMLVDEVERLRGDLDSILRHSSAPAILAAHARLRDKWESAR